MSPPVASAIAALVWLALLLKARAAARLTPRVSPRADPSTDPSRASPEVTVFVPARDEAEIIETSVRALAAQPGVARLVVIDDRSTDGTGELLARLAAEVPHLTVRAGRGPGSGECGKPAALRDAVRALEPTTEWLLFVDADVVLAPGAVPALVALARARGAALVTVFPALELVSAVERWLMPSIGALIAAAFPAAKVEDPNSPVAFANGQLILVSRAAYDAAGGHAAVVREILEDVRLAERVKRSGGRLVLADGREVARTRMYASARELIEGWSKNLYLLLGGRPWPALAWVVVTTALASLGWLALALDRAPWGLAAFAWVTGVQMLLRARGGTPAGWAVLAPLGALAVDALVARSAYLRWRGRVAWKGRSYEVR